MSVCLETSLGDLVIDLFVKECPKASENFLKLCKIKHFNNCLFIDVQKSFTATMKTRKDSSIYGILKGKNYLYFEDEIFDFIKHTKPGFVGMANEAPDLNASNFYISLGQDLSSLDGKHTIFGYVAEGLDIVERINKAYCDGDGRPYQDVVILHTLVIDDPFPDPAKIYKYIPSRSPSPIKKSSNDRLHYSEKIEMLNQDSELKLQELIKDHEARTQAAILTLYGDIPHQHITPPENVLFICRLNPLTTGEDLKTVFFRFGNIKDASVIKDIFTGDSLCYGFVEFEEREDCEEAVLKMQGALIDDRRVHVDFSQSVKKLWNQHILKKQEQQSGYRNEQHHDNQIKKHEQKQSKEQKPSKYSYIPEKNKTDRTKKEDYRRHENKKNRKSRSREKKY